MLEERATIKWLFFYL